MNLQEIKSAVMNGQTVMYGGRSKVICDKHNQWLIVDQINGYTIGLTWEDGTTMNGNETEFYILGMKPQLPVFPEGLKYVCIWNYLGDVATGKCKIVTPEYFCEDNGYEMEDIVRVSGMKAGDVIEWAIDEHMIFCIA